MKRTTSTTLLLLVLLGCAAGQTKGTDNDTLGIALAIENWNKGWQNKDPKLAAQDYSADADWTNAFGMTKKGRVEIEKFMTEVLALPFVMAAQSKTTGQTVRFIRSDVALVRTTVERVGQTTPSGESLGKRLTSHLRVFTKSGTGWQIVSHLISDARDTEHREH